MYLNQLSTFVSSPRNFYLTIIGAGPAGLACGIKSLQLCPNQPVLLLEKSQRVGGPCNTAKIGNFEFEVGCNQPPIGFEQTLKTLGVEHSFASRSNECVFENGTTLRSPFDFKTVWHFLSYPVSSAKFFWRSLYGETGKQLSSILLGLNPAFSNEVQASFSYPTLGPDINLGLLRVMMAQSMQYPRIPIGGMTSVTDKMRDRFLRLGGQVAFLNECQEIKKLPNGRKLIKTKNGNAYQSDLVISSVDAWKYYPPQSRPGLALTTLLFAIKSSCKYLRRTHTTAFLPKNFTYRMSEIRLGGSLPDSFGFHCFINSLPEQNGCYTVTAYMPTPRGIEELTEEQAKKIREYVITKIASRIHNFRAAIVESHVISPAEYVRRFGMANNIPLLESPAGFTAPKYNKEIDTYFIGSSVNSPNVLAAIDSGIKAAEDIHSSFSNVTYRV
jgi:phytoene dehydrogenase-like protein